MLSKHELIPQTTWQILQQVAITVAALLGQHQEDDAFDAALGVVGAEVFEGLVVVVAGEQIGDGALMQQIEADQLVVLHQFEGKVPVGEICSEVIDLGIRDAIAVELGDRMLDDRIAIGGVDFLQ